MAKEKKKVTRVFQMTPDGTMRFFLAIQELKKQGFEDTPALRLRILNEMGRQGMLDRVYDTKRTEDELVYDLKQKGFNIDDRRTKRDTRPQNYLRRIMAGLQRKLARLLKIFSLGNS